MLDAGAGLYESVTMDATERKKVDYGSDRIMQVGGWVGGWVLEVVLAVSGPSLLTPASPCGLGRRMWRRLVLSSWVSTSGCLGGKARAEQGVRLSVAGRVIFPSAGNLGVSLETRLC